MVKAEVVAMAVPDPLSPHAKKVRAESVEAEAVVLAVKRSTHPQGPSVLPGNADTCKSEKWWSENGHGMHCY